MGFFLFGMGSSVNTHQHTNSLHRHTCKRTHAHLRTCMHRYNTYKKVEHTHLYYHVLRSITRGDVEPFFFFSNFSYIYLFSFYGGLCSSSDTGEDPHSSCWVLLLRCCVFSNYRAWQWARTHKEYFWCYNYFDCL